MIKKRRKAGWTAKKLRCIETLKRKINEQSLIGTKYKGRA
jgi:hypothetical protein